jgi:hypothetical protein
MYPSLLTCLSAFRLRIASFKKRDSFKLCDFFAAEKAFHVAIDTLAMRQELIGEHLPFLNFVKSRS